MPEYCEIKIKGRFDPRWSVWFAGLQVADLEEDQTLLSGLLPDQSALHGLLERIRDLNISLVSVTCGPPERLNPTDEERETHDSNSDSTPVR